MKKSLSLLIVVLLIFSCSISVFATEATDSDSTNKVVLNELSKVEDKADREKIEQLIFTTFYGEFFEGDSTLESETDSLVQSIDYLNQFSGKELDRQIAKILKSTIESKVNDPSVSFTNEAVLLVEKYCPEELSKAKSRTGPAEMRADQELSIASAGWNTYLKSVTYQWKNPFGILQFQLSLTIDWGTDGNNNMAYCGVDSRSYKDNPGMSEFMTWSSGDYITQYTTYCKAYQKAYYLLADGSPHYPAITVTARNTGTISASGNTNP